jgi:hypothetical protein
LNDNVALFPDIHPKAAKRDNGTGSDNTGNGNPPGGDNVEARVARLETHIEYIRRDLDEVMVDVKSIKSRLAYFAGAGFVLLAIFAWVANNRFDQVLELLAK